MSEVESPPSDEMQDAEEDIYDLGEIIGTDRTPEALKAKLDEIRRQERIIYEFNTTKGKLLVRIVPIPLIIIGMIYQVYPEMLSFDITSIGSLSLPLLLIIIGQMSWQFVLGKRAKGLKMTRANFELQSLLKRYEGRPFKSLEGYDEVIDNLLGEYLQASLHRGMGVIALINYLITFFGALIWVTPYGYAELSNLSGLDAAPALLALSAGMGTGMTMALWGAVLLDKKVDLDASKPDGLMETYVPSGHSILLEHPLTDSLSGIMEPGIRAAFDEYLDRLSPELGSERTMGEAMERALYLIHLHSADVLDEDELRRELEEDWSSAGVLLDDEIFDFDLLKRLIERCKRMLPSLFKIIDRLEFRLSQQLNSLRSFDVIYDIEIERIVTGGRADLFVFALDNTHGERTFEVGVNCPMMMREQLSHKLHFRQQDVVEFPEEDVLPMFSRPQRDVVDLMSEMMDYGRIIWISLMPKSKGTGLVEVNLSDGEGNLLAGKVMSVTSRSDVKAAVKSQTGKISLLGGLMVPLLKILPQLRIFLGF